MGWQGLERLFTTRFHKKQKNQVTNFHEFFNQPKRVGFLLTGSRKNRENFEFGFLFISWNHEVNSGLEQGPLRWTEFHRNVIFQNIIV